MPTEIDEIQRKLTQYEIETEALKKEDDEASRERLEKIRSEMSHLREEIDRMKLHWSSEKEKISAIRKVKEEIESTKIDAEKAEREGSLGRAAELRYGKLLELSRRLESENSALAEIQREVKILKEEVDEEDIAAIVSKWTGIPVSKMLESETKKLIHLEDHLRKRVVGQDEAIHSISNAVRRARAGLKDPNQPIGSFIFMGPTGVGKTELARALSEALFDDEKAMVRLDMSEYMEKHSVARMIGAPPGYVGYEEGGQLTETVRRRPYCVILLDEIEKAHTDVFNILLQILDEGRLTDGKGRTVDFKNTIIIMTSNIASSSIIELRNSKPEEVKRSIEDVLKAHFRPEFLNRIDDIIIFRNLEKDDILKIVDIQVRRLKNVLLEKDINIELTEKAKNFIADEGFDAAFGARPLKRAIQRYIQNPLASSLLAGDFTEGETVLVDLNPDGTITFSKKLRKTVRK